MLSAAAFQLRQSQGAQPLAWPKVTILLDRSPFHHQDTMAGLMHVCTMFPFLNAIDMVFLEPGRRSMAPSVSTKVGSGWHLFLFQIKSKDRTNLGPTSMQSGFNLRSKMFSLAFNLRCVWVNKAESSSPPISDAWGIYGFWVLLWVR